MVKFMVVLCRKPGLSRAEFREYLQGPHGAMAEAIPFLRKYCQNHVVHDPDRSDPGWDAIIELWWSSRDEMEAAWRSPEGEKATADLRAFADVTRTSWSIVEEQVRR